MVYLYVSVRAADGKDVGQNVPAEPASVQLEHAESGAAADAGEMEEAGSGDEERPQQQQQYHELGDAIEEEQEDEEEVGHAEETAEVRVFDNCVIC